MKRYKVELIKKCDEDYDIKITNTKNEVSIIPQRQTTDIEAEIKASRFAKHYNTKVTISDKTH